MSLQRTSPFVLSFALLLVTMTSLQSPAQQEPAPGQKYPPRSIKNLEWLSGSWAFDKDKLHSEEHWTAAEHNGIIGMSRTVVGGRVVAFEYLRVEGRADGIYYVAMPNGKTATSFKLVKQEGESVVFENLEHDFPKRILYRKNADGSLTARIDDGEGGAKFQEFPFQPMKK
jgi:hypothetical protein